MYTWFDALLVTLLAILTALGIRRGLVGLMWGVAGILICLILGTLVKNVVIAVVLAFVLSAAISFGAAKFLPEPYTRPWHFVAGGAGGFMLGLVLLAALTLSFPIGKGMSGEMVYPAQSLPPHIYAGVHDSTLRKSLMSVWTGDSVLKALLVPDQTR